MRAAFRYAAVAVVCRSIFKFSITCKKQKARARAARGLDRQTQQRRKCHKLKFGSNLHGFKWWHLQRSPGV